VFRDRLSAAMAEAGTSRAALARVVGIDRSTVTQMLTEDVRMPGGHVVANMASVLGVSCDWLLGLSDRPERVSALDRHVAFDLGDRPRQRGADDQIFAWHEEAAGYKIRHVPATLPDVLKTDALMEWEYAPAKVKTPGQAIAAAHARLEWMRGTTSDYEIAIPLTNSRVSFPEQAITPGWPRDLRREQLRWFAEVYDQLFPSLRLFLYDARTVFSAPLTIFGPRLAVIYVGRHYVAFRDRERVRAMSRHFDWLVREATVSDRDFGAHVRTAWSRFKTIPQLLKIIGKLWARASPNPGVTLWRPMHAVHG
jgi:transcriptional regulator with XRE-family HTH domain